MLSKLDLWVGKKLLVPVIIRICQFFNITNHYFANTVSFVGGLAIFYASWQLLGEFQHTWSYVMWMVMCVLVSFMMLFRLIVAGLYPHMALSADGGFWRKEALIFVILGLVLNALGEPLRVTQIFWWCSLLAEWARSIDRIPPKEKKEPKRKLVRARA